MGDSLSVLVNDLNINQNFRGMAAMPTTCERKLIIIFFFFIYSTGPIRKKSCINSPWVILFQVFFF